MPTRRHFARRDWVTVAATCPPALCAHAAYVGRSGVVVRTEPDHALVQLDGGAPLRMFPQAHLVAAETCEICGKPRTWGLHCTRLPVEFDHRFVARS